MILKQIQKTIEKFKSTDGEFVREVSFLSIDENKSSKEIRTKRFLRSRLIRAAKKELAKIEAESKENDYRNSKANNPSASLNEIRRILDRIKLILSSHKASSHKKYGNKINNHKLQLI